MCGLFGFITRDGSGPDLARLGRIAIETQQRGRHAFGLAWLDASGRVQTLKRPGAASKWMHLLGQCTGARIVIGHCRYATHGDPADNRNNHPHAAGSGVFVHNGMVRNFEQLIATHDLEPTTECDSEVLGLLMAQSSGSLLSRSARSVAVAEGPLAMLGLWRNPDRLVLARRGNPLHFGATRGGFYFGSLPAELPGDVRQVIDGSVSVMTITCKGLELESRKIPTV